MQHDLDKKSLEHFINRMGMYIHPTSKETIVSFIHGYEVGRGNQELTNLISQLLDEQFGIKRKATGWPNQIESYSKKKEINWIEGFKEIMQILIKR